MLKKKGQIWFSNHRPYSSASQTQSWDLGPPALPVFHLCLTYLLLITWAWGQDLGMSSLQWIDVINCWLCFLLVDFVENNKIERNGDFSFYFIIVNKISLSFNRNLKCLVETGLAWLHITNRGTDEMISCSVFSSQLTCVIPGEYNIKKYKQNNVLQLYLKLKHTELNQHLSHRVKSRRITSHTEVQ